MTRSIITQASAALLSLAATSATLGGIGALALATPAQAFVAHPVVAVAHQPVDHQTVIVTGHRLQTVIVTGHRQA